MWRFEQGNLRTVSEALDIAEDATVNYYKFSTDQWKRHRYDVKTLSFLKDDEIRQDVFAFLNKGTRAVNEFDSKAAYLDFYFICLQDHEILKALKRDRELGILSLLVYIFTHELVHIVRFCNFSQRFDVSVTERDKEEKFVHLTTFDILRNLKVPKLDYILNSYQCHRICETAMS